MKSHEEQELRAQAEQARGKLQGLTDDLRVVDEEVESLAPQRAQHELLDQVCGSLQKLDELGAASLFWGEWMPPTDIERQLEDARSRVRAFQAQLGELDDRRQKILDEIGNEEDVLADLGAEIYHVREAEERKKLEWVVEREISVLAPRKQRMAWARGGEDDKRFRKSLAASLFVALLLGLLLPLIRLPLPKRFEPSEVPERLAQLARKAQLKPVPPPPVKETKPEEELAENEEPEPVEPDPTEQAPEETEVAAAEPDPTQPPGPAGPPGEPGRKAVEKAGILAFREEFAGLAKDDVTPRLGADARYGDADEASRTGMPTRSMLTTNAPGSSGGINIGSLSRNVGGGGGPGGAGGMRGVQVGRATSSIAKIGNGGGGRPRAGGGQAPSRTDEEIQIVFDRYKASFYRLYNRELRNDPTLRGQMVLRLTIEPDGSVSMCKLQSTNMKAPSLAAQVVERVLSINFGAKEGVQALTIVYPIDFLPKA